MGGWKFTGRDFDERELREALDDVVDETTRAVAGDAGDNAPVDRGALSVSYYASGPHGSNYNQVVGAMLEKNPRIAKEPETPLEDWSGDDVHMGLVDSAAPYAPLVEDGHMGSSGRYVAGRPSLRNALRGQQDQMMSRTGAALRRLGIKKVGKA